MGDRGRAKKPPLRWMSSFKCGGEYRKGLKRNSPNGRLPSTAQIRSAPSRRSPRNARRSLTLPVPGSFPREAPQRPTVVSGSGDRRSRLLRPSGLLIRTLYPYSVTLSSHADRVSGPPAPGIGAIRTFGAFRTMTVVSTLAYQRSCVNTVRVDLSMVQPDRGGMSPLHTIDKPRRRQRPARNPKVSGSGFP